MSFVIIKKHLAMLKSNKYIYTNSKISKLKREYVDNFERRINTYGRNKISIRIW